MLSTLLCVALSQEPTKVAVVHSSNLGVSAKRVAEVTQLLRDLLAAQQLEVVESKLPCENRGCLTTTAVELGTDAVISIAFAPIGKDIVTDLECVRAADGKTVAQRTFTLKAADVALPPEASEFALAVKSAPLKAPAEPRVVEKQPDAPKDTKLTPAVQPQEPELIVERPQHSRAPAITVGVAAIVVAAGAAVLLALANTDANEANRQRSPGIAAHTREESLALASQANTKYTASLVTGIGAGLLAATAMVLFVY